MSNLFSIFGRNFRVRVLRGFCVQQPRQRPPNRNSMKIRAPVVVVVAEVEERGGVGGGGGGFDS